MALPMMAARNVGIAQMTNLGLLSFIVASGEQNTDAKFSQRKRIARPT